MSWIRLFLARPALVVTQATPTSLRFAGKTDASAEIQGWGRINVRATDGTRLPMGDRWLAPGRHKLDLVLPAGKTWIVRVRNLFSPFGAKAEVCIGTPTISMKPLPVGAPDHIEVATQRRTLATRSHPLGVMGKPADSPRGLSSEVLLPSTTLNQFGLMGARISGAFVNIHARLAVIAPPVRHISSTIDKPELLSPVEKEKP